MVFLRIILFPISLLYGLVSFIRNKLFDSDILPSKTFDIPVISLGNLTYGGTGKTPHVEYLVRLLQDRYKVAILSRGYGRKTKGFIIATPKSKVHEIGDEPLQFRKKFSSHENCREPNRRENGS